ncbi:MAG: PrsW family intramembrane metalloprotease [Methanospirillum sp.]|uniref:PrsW family intramembrane metalloprotease n=1 Tax=Methanospirillum sp. TaxID=45200 RepID=UPI00236FC5CC|nr:PrsW family intramembrane metalloprotease [Methanospirillum sp.]MDD1730502.1 PrsW family intramembrane metalloprotease [Methanospirillum sp.]
MLTLSYWEIRRFFTTMSRDLLPLSVILVILLLLVSGFAAQRGMHLQDGLYQIGIDSPAYFDVIGADTRFSVYDTSKLSGVTPRNAGLDLKIEIGNIQRSPGEKGKAAQKSFERDYQAYTDRIYQQQDDIFAAYPLWIQNDYVTSELNFLATQSGEQLGISGKAFSEAPEPDLPIEEVSPPVSSIPADSEELRMSLAEQMTKDQEQLNRYTGIFSKKGTTEIPYKVPSLLSPPLPFDTIIFIFVFIFPLYFSSQFFMMSIMNERTLRQGEALIAAPIRPSVLVLGKMLPYAMGMILLASAILLVVHVEIIAILPLIPIIFFFLSSALFIGMISRSYKELSFISIFFSTIATSYLFFPSLFANVHVVSLLSPVTLVVYVIQGTGYTLTDYLYATSLFYLTSVILFAICIRNFREEQLFSETSMIEKITSYLGGLIMPRHWWFSLFIIGLICIPFVLMAQMMYLVLLFNLPMPVSLILIMVLAAMTEELAKGSGIIALITAMPGFLNPRILVISSALLALGFLVGEKLLLFVTISQISDSVFGAALFLNIGMLWMPFLLHLVGVGITGGSVLFKGPKAFPIGVALATGIHVLYNLYLLRGWIW